MAAPGSSSAPALHTTSQHAARSATLASVGPQLREARAQGAADLKLARTAVVTEHLWLARALAHRYRRPHQDFEDLLQVACLGLTEAVNRFDLDRGEFLAYATATITGLIKHHFRDHAWSVRPTRACQELLGEMRRAWPQLTQELRHEPSHEEMAERLGVTVDEVAQAERSANAYQAASVETLPEAFAELGFSDQLKIQRIEARLMVARALADLDDDDRRLIQLRFYEQLSQSDIARELGTNQMQVSRRLARLIRRMRRIMEEPS